MQNSTPLLPDHQLLPSAFIDAYKAVVRGKQGMHHKAHCPRPWLFATTLMSRTPLCQIPPACFTWTGTGVLGAKAESRKPQEPFWTGCRVSEESLRLHGRSVMKARQRWPPAMQAILIYSQPYGTHLDRSMMTNDDDASDHSATQ